MLDILFGSKLRAKALSWMLAHPDEWYYIRQLTSILQVDSTNLSRELSRLTGIGILLSRVEGRQKYYRANEGSPIFMELRGLVVKTGGVGDILRKALAPLAERIRAAFIFGSVAEGREQASSDVDLMIIGNVSLGELVKVLGPGQAALGREINPVVYLPDEFQARVQEGHHFLKQVLSENKVYVIGGEDELNRLAQ